MEYAPSPGCFEISQFWRSECVGQIALYLYLLPSGFRTSPAYGIVSLLCVWLLGVGIYYPYSWIMRARTASDRPVVSIFFWLDVLFKRRSKFVGATGEDTPETKLPHGFRAYSDDETKNLNLFMFSLDATLPVLNLRAYDSFFPTVTVVQIVSVLQHLLGWWVVTALLASFAVL